MKIVVRPAAEEDDPAVAALFSRHGVPVLDEYWHRAYSPEAPRGSASLPLVAVTDEGALLGFLAARPIRLRIDPGFRDALLVHDMLVPEGDEQRDAATALVAELKRRSPIIVVSGAGTALSPLLEWLGFFTVGFFGRHTYKPGTPHLFGNEVPQPYDAEGNIPFGPPLEALNQAMIRDRRLFRLRDPEDMTWLARGPAASRNEVFIVRESSSGMDAYFVLRTEAGRFGNELVAVDLAAPRLLAGRLAMTLARLADERAVVLHLNLFATDWEAPLKASGFVAQRPRWPLHWLLSQPGRDNAGATLANADNWFFTAMDGAVDGW